MIEVNLHPTGEKKKRRRRTTSTTGWRERLPDFDFGGLDALRSDPWTTALIATLVIVPVVVGFLWFMQRSREADLQERLEAARADSVRLAELRALSDSLTQRRQQVRQRIALVRGLDNDRFVWPHLLDQISSTLPDLAWLRTIQRMSPLPGMEVQLMGTAATPLVITDYVRNLEASPYIGNVQIVGSNKQTEGGRTVQAFTLNLRYTPPPETSVRTTALAAEGR